MALSRRGKDLAKIPFDHGWLDAYHPIDNPNGCVKFLFAENVCCQEIRLVAPLTDNTSRD